MTTFDKREQAFEAKFARDEDLRFKSMARCNKLLGNWAAEQLGLTCDVAAAYADDLVTTNLQAQTIDEVLAKVSRDLAPKGISGQQVAEKMSTFSSYRAGTDRSRQISGPKAVIRYRHPSGVMNMRLMSRAVTGKPAES